MDYEKKVTAFQGILNEIKMTGGFYMTTKTWKRWPVNIQFQVFH